MLVCLTKLAQTSAVDHYQLARLDGPGRGSVDMRWRHCSPTQHLSGAEFVDEHLTALGGTNFDRSLAFQEEI